VRVPNPNVRRGSRGSQACVSFRKKPARSDGTSATWEFTKPELAQILENWDEEVSFAEHTVGTASPFVTARARKAPAAPIREALKSNPAPEGQCKVLYHGVGKDRPGAEAIGRGGQCQVSSYDKYSPETELQKKPTGQHNEVYSIYTLNVVPETEAKEIVQELHDRLKPGGKAIVSTRRDVCRGGLLPKTHGGR